MSRAYDWDEAGLVVEGENCPTCHSGNTRFDHEFGFWKCEDCSTVWAEEDNLDDELEACPACTSTDTVQLLGLERWRCRFCGFEFRAKRVEEKHGDC